MHGKKLLQPAVEIVPMIRRLAMFALAWMLCGYMPASASQTADVGSPVGLWKTIDDKTGKARALVRVFEEHGQLFGRIEQTFTAGGETRVCVPCTDERKNQPIIGLLVIRHMIAEGGPNGRTDGRANSHANTRAYSGGDILDPESGSVYRCQMHLEDDGSRLVVRGYIGFSLLGRSQVWQRQG